MSTAIGLVVAFAQDFHKRFPKNFLPDFPDL
nr:hypothetical protein [Lactobacillus delbrueckii]